jgi:pimeloyl-ACP methyl ester carboxylesterase
MAIPHETGRVRSGDVSIHYRKLGRAGATPLLIVHGLSYFSYDWLPIGQVLGDEREVVAMDLRGFGDSDCSPSTDYSVPTMAGDIVRLLDHLGWTRAALAGHSMGGRSTTYAAAKHPERVSGLALVDYTPENAPAGSKRVTERVGNQPDAFPSLEAAMQYFGKNDRARFEAYLRKADAGLVVKRDLFFRDQFRKLLQTGERPKLGVDMWQLLGEVLCPILSIRGERSDMYAPESVEKMKAANARLRVTEVANAGHDVAGDNPQGLLAALRPFLRETSDEYARH